MNLIHRLTATATRIARDIADAPRVHRQLRQLRTTQAAPATPARRVVEVDIDPANVPDVEDITLAAKEYEAARAEANAAARLRRRAERILRRTPSGVHGHVVIERVESSRQVIDADAVKAVFAELGRDVPMKTCAPSLVVSFADEAAPEQAAPALIAA